MTPDKLAPEDAETAASPRDVSPFWYLLLGTLFGVVLVKSEAVSWFRIQEMFRFQGFHMYGIIFSAIAVAAPLIWILRRSSMKTLTREPIDVPPKELGWGYRYAIGGTLFGVGWALGGACPGPMFALASAGQSVYVAAILGALAGTWLYGYLRPRLPHY
ncbi:MAG: YeeE/YedE family protein [Acidobacteria bacterium]|nr:YeeE/YedE family protein [Acidobacteriota bacterium]